MSIEGGKEYAGSTKINHVMPDACWGVATLPSCLVFVVCWSALRQAKQLEIATYWFL